MKEMKIGATRVDSRVVAQEDVITFLGPGGSQVLATPRMIQFMEWASRFLVADMLEEGYATVGLHVNIWHLAAAPLGATVTYKAELLKATSKRCEFKVEARLGEKLIGEGTHLRAIVDIKKFAKT